MLRCENTFCLLVIRPIFEICVGRVHARFDIQKKEIRKKEIDASQPIVSSNADVGAKRKIVIKIRSKLEEPHMRCRAQLLGCVLMFEVQIESFFSITIV